jgi:hypothetical protein
MAERRRLDAERVESRIADEAYHHFPGTTLTVCCLTLVNGFHVTGESACVWTEDFDEGVGREMARRDAVAKAWAFEACLLRERWVREGRT